MNFLIRLRLCYPTFGCCRTHQYPSFARSAQTCCDRSNPLFTKELVVILSKCDSTALWCRGIAATVRVLWHLQWMASLLSVIYSLLFCFAHHLLAHPITPILPIIPIIVAPHHPILVALTTPPRCLRLPFAHDFVQFARIDVQ